MQFRWHLYDGGRLLRRGNLLQCLLLVGELPAQHLICEQRLHRVHWALFVGQWPSTFMCFGLYHRLIRPGTK